MAKHFGVTMYNKPGGFKLNPDTYIEMKQSEDALLNEKLILKKKALTNLSLHMKYFQSLSHKDFDAELNKFVESHNFEEISDLNAAEKLKGFYIMVLDDYCQVYIGISNNIKARIREHWSKQISLDELLWHTDQGFSLHMSVDSFRALDTTRIFVRPCPECNFSIYPLVSVNEEDKLIRSFPYEYCMNRSYKGWLLDEIREAHGKREKFLMAALNELEST